MATYLVERSWRREGGLAAAAEEQLPDRPPKTVLGSSLTLTSLSLPLVPLPLLWCVFPLTVPPSLHVPLPPSLLGFLGSSLLVLGKLGVLLSPLQHHMSSFLDHLPDLSLPDDEHLVLRPVDIQSEPPHHVCHLSPGQDWILHNGLPLPGTGPAHRHQSPGCPRLSRPPPAKGCFMAGRVHRLT